MTDHASNDAQALWDAAARLEDEPGPPEPIGIVLQNVLEAAFDGRVSDGVEDVHPLSDRQATAAIWIDGHEYSLTLNRED